MDTEMYPLAAHRVVRTANAGVSGRGGGGGALPGISSKGPEGGTSSVANSGTPLVSSIPGSLSHSNKPSQPGTRPASLTTSRAATPGPCGEKPSLFIRFIVVVITILFSIHERRFHWQFGSSKASLIIRSTLTCGMHFLLTVCKRPASNTGGGGRDAARLSASSIAAYRSAILSRSGKSGGYAGGGAGGYSSYSEAGGGGRAGAMHGGMGGLGPTRPAEPTTRISLQVSWINDWSMPRESNPHTGTFTPIIITPKSSFVRQLLVPPLLTRRACESIGDLYRGLSPQACRRLCCCELSCNSRPSSAKEPGFAHSEPQRRRRGLG